MDVELSLTALALPAFLAGILTFLAPCTLPLLPGYLGFISGSSVQELQNADSVRRVRRKIFFNGVFYVLGFSLVFIVLGSLFGLGGAALAKHRVVLTRVGGVFVIFFGLYMMNVLRLPIFRFLSSERRLHPTLKPGNPSSSFIFGATFAFGWSPCIGPILGSILLLASTSATLASGALLLAIFSLGLAVPFLAVALAVSSVTKYLRRLGRALAVISIVGGAFLVFLGVLLLLNRFGILLTWFYKTFSFINYDQLLDYL